MNDLDTNLTAIARQHLAIPTLRMRSSDALDFHTVAVWAIRSALKDAFDAGRESAPAPSAPTANELRRYDDYEIQPCRRYRDSDDPNCSFVEPCEAFEADFWTLYGHIPGEGVEAIGDFDTSDHAEEVYARITGRSYR